MSDHFLQISIGPGPGGWVAYGILIILALVYLALLLMLLVKLLEAVVRIVGGIGFDRSRHVVDSGLLGACGLLGCCGPRSRRRRKENQNRKHKYKPTDAQPTLPQAQHRDSDVSSYIPPQNLHDNGTHTPPKFPSQDTSSRKGSTHSGPPPSVLRPEHALRPYREDSDDENGYIMGAWQPFPRPGYTAVTNAPLTAAPGTILPNQQQHAQQGQQKSSGFSRVGGGRAHIDTPYAINAGSTHTFPSIAQHSGGATSSPVFYDDEDDSPPPSFSNVGRQNELGGLPPGAMQPAHIRTKSQTAIIENPSTASPNSGRPSPGTTPGSGSGSGSGSGLSVPSERPRLGSSGLLHPPIMSHMAVANDEDDDNDSEDQTPKKKPWYHIGRRRLYSSEGSGPNNAPVTPEVANPPIDAEMGGATAATGSPARSFVVIRKPQISPGRDVRNAHATT